MARLIATSWLDGSVEVPFPIISALVGLVFLATLVYFARRAG